jgi:tRNA(Ile)-lysidine synthase TilS/MesJ
MWGDDKSLIRRVMVRCDRCGREAVHFQRYSGLRLCGEHLGASLESRAKREIRAGGGIRQGDRIAVGLPGGPDSSSLLRFLSVHFGMRRDISLFAITVDGGGGPGGDLDLARVRGIAEGMGVRWAVTSPIGEGGEAGGVARPPDDGGDARSRHTRLRDHALTSLALEMGATKLALGTSLDDVAREVFLRVIRGDPARLLWKKEGRGEIPVVRPFSRIPREELLLYARLNGIDFIPEEARAAPGSLGNEAERLLADYAGRHPSALFSLASTGRALAGMPWHPSGGPGMETTRHPGRRLVVEPEPSPGTGAPAPSPPRGRFNRVKGHG